jgi:hypothetical protein
MSCTLPPRSGHLGSLKSFEGKKPIANRQISVVAVQWILGRAAVGSIKYAFSHLVQELSSLAVSRKQRAQPSEVYFQQWPTSKAECIVRT